MQKIKNYYHLLQALIASAIFSFPSRKLKVIGVTGTDGKTTTVHMIYETLKTAGFKVAAISSIGAVISGKKIDTGFHVTTPDAIALQKFLRKTVDAGSEYLVLEVTSHGLDQNRVAFIPFEVGVLTNVTHEHLDYHKTFENYWRAKGKLFQRAKISILNVDDSSFKVLKKKVSGKLITYGIKNEADFTFKDTPFKLKIAGDYNYYNGLAAAAVARTLGVQPLIIQKSLENFSGLAGRMEEIDEGQNFKVIVDFAHTPNALEQALKTLRSSIINHQSSIIAVFGSAGERDKLKRPLMGAVSSRLADITVITAEDPRTENPAIIANQILFGCKKAGGVFGKNVFIELDRGKAVKLAITLAQKGDTVAIFGKGCEKSMAYDGKEHPWSDQKTAQVLLKKLRKK